MRALATSWDQGVTIRMFLSSKSCGQYHTASKTDVDGFNPPTEGMEGVDGLVDELERKGLGSATTYLRNARDELLTVIKLQANEQRKAPKTMMVATSAVERGFREITAEPRSVQGNVGSLTCYLKFLLLDLLLLTPGSLLPEDGMHSRRKVIKLCFTDIPVKSST